MTNDNATHNDPSHKDINAEHFARQQQILTQLLELQRQQMTLSAATTNNAATVAVPNPSVPPPPTFSYKAEEWAEWKCSFYRYKRTVLVSCSSEQTVDYFIGHLGTKAEKILKSFHLSTEDQKNFAIVLERFDAYFGERKNLVYERVKFLQRVQGSDEPCDIFISDLTAMAQTCEWAQLEGEMIKLRIIAGLADSRLSIQLQTRPDDNVDEVIKRVRLAESLRKQQAVIRASAPAPANAPTQSVTEPEEVSAIYHSRGAIPKQKPHMQRPNPHVRTADYKNDTKSCRKCGLIPRHAFASCPSRNDTCKKCGKIGHWSTRCLSKVNNRQNPKIASVETAPDEEDNFFMGSIDTSKPKKPWRAIVNVNDTNLDFKLDCGADVTVIRWDDLKKLNKTLVDAPKSLISASGDKIQIVGTFDADLRYRNRKSLEKIYVAKKLRENLLGRDALETLGMLSWANVASIAEQFPTLFEGIGNLGKTYHIKIKENAVPFAIAAARRVPLHLRDAVKKHLDKLENESIIRKVSVATNWCAPMVVVPKKNNSVRICVDYTILNKSVQSERMILPEISESLALIEAEAEYFSKLDAASGFYHIPLDTNSQLLTTFITPFGRYAFQRLPMGITSATERFQREMMETLEGLEGVVNLADDMLIFGKTKVEHDQRLAQVLERLKQRGLRLNKEKCVFGKKKVKFLGYTISKEGVGIDEDKVKAVLEMPAPKNVSGVRQLLGTLQVNAKFLPELANIASPISQLLSTKYEFCWTERQQAALEAIKIALTSAPVLSHFSPNSNTRVAADASSFGLGAVLEQEQKDGTWKPVSYASRKMSETESRYAQIEREALAATWACEKFQMYLLGKHFSLRTDHKPLVQLLGTKPLSDLSARLQRFRMRLMQYSYNVEYIPGKKMIIADMLSRAPIESTDPGSDALLIDEVEAFAQHIGETLPFSDARLQRIREAQVSDPQTKRVREYIVKGWPTKKRMTPEDRSFHQFEGQMAILNDLLMRGNRVFIPRDYRSEILDQIHVGHLGITKCKSRAKETVWWPGINSHIEDKISNCNICIEHRTPPTEKLKPSETPEYPWQMIGADLCKVAGRTYIVAVDYWSRYLEVANMKSETAEEAIAKLRTFMARWGIPEILRTDNGPCFRGNKFKDFAEKYGFQHITSSPLYPQSNGQAEAAVKIAKKILTKCEDPNLGLLSYRTAKLSCGLSPSELIMGRTPRSNVPANKSLYIPTWSYLQSYKRKREVEKAKYAADFNIRHRARSVSPLGIGKQVWITNAKKYGVVVNKGPEPRTYIIAADNNVYRRNRSHLIGVTNIPIQQQEDLDIDLPEDSQQISREEGKEMKDDNRGRENATIVETEAGEGSQAEENGRDQQRTIVAETEESARQKENEATAPSPTENATAVGGKIEANTRAHQEKSNAHHQYVTRSGRLVKPPRNICNCTSGCNH
ncbi:uncharacterized protein K02A2.6-like [Photinus pyralis]|uniref:uncharacterized protein K02A2.6-like n=1 Tax=Photinus pyralis TaxID=7054 RepID=UPI001266FEF4|nr:uncharacterized protein K02A2.6-like [Photinus pyralis]